MNGGFYFFAKTVCADCHRYDGEVVRVFESEAAYRASGMATGEDGLDGDPYARFAAWPGKNNVGRGEGAKILAPPIHPWCACSFHAWSPVRERAELLDWFADIPEAEMEAYLSASAA